MNPGTLNRRLVLEAPTETPDGAGGVARGFAAVRTLWASVEATGFAAEIEAERLGASSTHTIIVRAGGEINTRHRLREGARVFRIVALRERPGRLVEIRAALRID